MSDEQDRGTDERESVPLSALRRSVVPAVGLAGGTGAFFFIAGEHYWDRFLLVGLFSGLGTSSLSFVEIYAARRKASFARDAVLASTSWALGMAIVVAAFINVTFFVTIHSGQNYTDALAGALEWARDKGMMLLFIAFLAAFPATVLVVARARGVRLAKQFLLAAAISALACALSPWDRGDFALRAIAAVGFPATLVLSFALGERFDRWLAARMREGRES